MPFPSLKALTSTAMLLGFLPFSASAQPAPKLTEQEAYAIGVEAYQYFYPAVLMEITRKVSTNTDAPGMGPMNEFHHMRAFPDASFRTVVRPNFDTLYSIAWLDLRKEPVIVSAPDTNGRYYLLPLIDMWTDVFAVPGKRTSGTQATQFAVTFQGWSGKLPDGVERINAPTPYVWIIGRTQTNGAKDYDAVHAIQDGYKITPLSQWGQKTQQTKLVIDPSVDMKTPPLEQIRAMSAETFFTTAANLLKENPAHITDWSTLARLKHIGIEPGKSFSLDNAPMDVRTGLKRANVDGIEIMKEKAPSLARIVNGWQMNIESMGVYGNNYLKRAVVAMVGLGANQPEDAIYPLNVADAKGAPLTGENKYVIHFNKNDIPPVEAFWSLTMYDADGFQVANALNRFAIGDRDPLVFNPDGSLDIFIQNESPGKDHEANWLPSPATGVLSVTMRLYAPKPAILEGRWAPPAITKLGE